MTGWLPDKSYTHFSVFVKRLFCYMFFLACVPNVDMKFSRAFECVQSYTSQQRDVANSLGASCSVDGSSVDGDGFDRILSGYHSDADERCSYTTETLDNCNRNVKRKRITVKKESTPPPKTVKVPYVCLVMLKNIQFVMYNISSQHMKQRLYSEDSGKVVETHTIDAGC